MLSLPIARRSPHFPSPILLTLFCAPLASAARLSVFGSLTALDGMAAHPLLISHILTDFLSHSCVDYHDLIGHQEISGIHSDSLSYFSEEKSVYYRLNGSLH